MFERSKRFGFIFAFAVITGLVSQMGCQTKYEGIGPVSSRTPAAPAITFNDLGPAIRDITSNLDDYPNNLVPRYGKFELTFHIDGAFQNPYNPAEIRVEAYFTSPGGEVLVQPGFYYQDYEPNIEAGTETLVPVGDPVWKVRFSPMETGLYQYYIQAAEGTAGTKTPQSTFEVANSDDPGFIRISPANSRYFEFQNGDPFLGIGLNVAWWQQPETGISTYKTYFDRMGEYRANLARVWMTNSGMDQGWILSLQDQTLGADYNLTEAWMLDAMIELARQNDVRLILTLEDVNQFGHSWNWDVNLYNSVNNGPCETQSEIFTNPEAREYQDRVFRYIVARWGYSPNILSWELFNEIDELRWSDQANFDSDDLVDWHAEKARFIKSIDAHQHIVNTSTGSFKTHPYLYQALEEIEFAQIHFYYVPEWPWHLSDPEGRDMAALTRYYAGKVYESVSDEPAIVGEFGLSGAGWGDSPLLEYDDQGVHLHNALWSSLMSGMASTGLSWHWNAHRQFDAAWWRHYAAAANFFEGLQTANLSVMQPLNVSALELFNIPSSDSIEADLNNGILPAALQQAFEAQQVPLFEDPKVRTISGDTQWVIDAYTSGNLVKTYTLIKSGASIYVYVKYGDPLDSADFSSENGKLRAMGLREDDRVYIWIQNTDSTWWNYIHDPGLDTQTGTLTISGFRSGCSYTVEWWDPWESEVGQQIISSYMIEANISGELNLDLRGYRQEGLQSDAAVKIYPQACENPLLSWLPLIYSFD
jgi:hypothetical protein